MFILLKPILIAALSTFVAIYILYPIAFKLNLLDLPNSRKNHKDSIPLIGGIAMFIGLIIGILFSPIEYNNLNYFLLSALILIIVGIVDDFSNISVRPRLLFQIIAALVLVTVGGVSIQSFGNILGFGEVFLGKWSLLISVLAIMAAINAVNMADGAHGLAGGNSLISLMGISYLAINSSSMDIFVICILLSSVLVVFLVFNLSNRKRIFMGDSGSMFLGLSLVWALIFLSQGENKVFSPVIALWLFALPLFELFSTVLRRIISGVSPFKADSSHSHHLLIELGLTGKSTVLLLLMGTILTVLLGIIGVEYAIAEKLMLISFVLVFIVYFFAKELAWRIINK